jgi:hypothetical protein
MVTPDSRFSRAIFAAKFAALVNRTSVRTNRFFCSDHSRYMTGKILEADRGLSAVRWCAGTMTLP